MSQINDALKKASRSHRAPNNPPPSAVPTPTVVQSVPAPTPAPVPAAGNRGFPIGAMAVLAVALLLSGWFVRDWWEDNRPPSDDSRPLAFGAGGQAATPPPVVIQEEPTANQPLLPEVGGGRVERAVSQPIAPAVQPKAAAVVAPPPVSPAVPPSPVFPALRLQGIVFRLKDPSVLINGKTLYVGDEINGVRVAKIERLSATVTFGGESRTLVMK